MIENMGFCEYIPLVHHFVKRARQPYRQGNTPMIDPLGPEQMKQACRESNVVVGQVKQVAALN